MQRGTLDYTKTSMRLKHVREPESIHSMRICESSSLNWHAERDTITCLLESLPRGYEYVKSNDDVDIF